MDFVCRALEQGVRLLAKHAHMQATLAALARFGELATRLQVVVPAQTLLGFAAVVLQLRITQCLRTSAFACTFGWLVWRPGLPLKVSLSAPVAFSIPFPLGPR